MSRKYRSGFERLRRITDDPEQRYKIALRAVREHFTGFGVADGYSIPKVGKLTENQKHQIRRYYNYLEQYTEGSPTYKMTVSELPKQARKTKKNIDKVKQAAMMGKGRQRSKYIFVPFDGVTPPKIQIVDDTIRFYNPQKGYGSELIPLDKRSLAIDPDNTIRQAVAHIEDAKAFRVVSGDSARHHEFYGAKGSYATAGNIKALSNYVEKLMERYGNEQANNYWGNWMFGIMAYYGSATIGQITLDTAKNKLAWGEIDKRRKPGESFDEYVKRRNREVVKKRSGKK